MCFKDASDEPGFVDAHKEQLVHWILTNAGYSCCPADIMELTGYDPEERNLLLVRARRSGYVSVWDKVGGV